MTIERDSEEGQWLRSQWRKLLRTAPTAVEYSKWIVTGIAAILAVIIASLDSITKEVSLGLFKTGLVVLVLSLLAGAISCLLALSLSAGVESSERSEAKESDATPPITEDMLRMFVAPFWGPLGWITKRALRKAMLDPFYVEKSQLFLVCLDSLFILATIALAVIALVLMALSITLN